MGVSGIIFVMELMLILLFNGLIYIKGLVVSDLFALNNTNTNRSW